ncbi:3-hydroxyacyl-ACP dehydratase FabZ [Bacillota bacterium LX-D]|nr:3-hydroxyacyl-ACP dehydratase FabZ [Bacillota bacterium LX-D]
MLNTVEIQKILPHRYPFLLVDRVISIEEGKKITGIKNVTINEPFFQGHFPEYPVMPGVLIIEALAQVGAVAMLSKPEYQGKIAFLAGIDGARFRRQVFPGDTLELKVELLKLRGNIGKARGEAYVGEELACQVELMFAIEK